tara:strand:+ start:220 stop:732 length:513 start_codon:yes stop_codon:yes gene_type:complete
MKKIFLIVVLLFLQINYAFANIAYVDMQKILSTSNPGKSILTQLSELNNKNKKNFKIKEEQLKIKEQKVISQKNIISEKEFQSNINSLKIEIANFNKERNDIFSSFNKLKIDNTNKLLKLINPILVEYSQKKSITMILRKKNIIMGKTELDITNEIITLINTNIKKFKIK